MSSMGMMGMDTGEESMVQQQMIHEQMLQEQMMLGGQVTRSLVMGRVRGS